jgi:hypothetical protein
MNEKADRARKKRAQIARELSIDVTAFVEDNFSHPRIDRRS